jgi:hypothetical protein
MTHRLTEKDMYAALECFADAANSRVMEGKSGGYSLRSAYGQWGVSYSDVGETSEWSVSGLGTLRETVNFLRAASEGIAQKRKRDKEMFVPLIAEAWCDSRNAECEVNETKPYYIDPARREEAIRAAGEAGGILRSLLLTLRRIYGDREIDSWYRDAVTKRECP